MTAAEPPGGLSADAATAAAQRYFRELGLQVRRAQPGAKGILERAWQKARPLNDAIIRAMFPPRALSNVCSVWGIISRDLADIEAETVLGTRALDVWLPPSPVCWGSPKNPGSHRLLRIAGSPEHIKTRKFTGPQGRVVIELRADGAQSILPPSVHPSGKPYALAIYEPASPIPEIGYDDLVRLCECAAATILLGEHAPTLSANHTRHHAALSMSGIFLRR
jgi:putative DNA primase/helicase